LTWTTTVKFQVYSEMTKKQHPLVRRFWRSVKKWILVFLNPHMLLCFGIAWMITNGWSYVLAGIGTLAHLPWMTAIGVTWLSIVWLPFTPEKILTLLIAVFLLRLLFPKDEKTLAVVKNELARGRAAIRRQKNKRKAKKAGKKKGT